MELHCMEQNGVKCAVIESTEKVITSAQSALDVLMQSSYALGTKNLIVSKKLVAEDFFILSTGLAGDVLQKIINYGGRIAIYGDYSRYTSKPLHDFIRESNRGKNVFFAATEQEAVSLLTER